MRLNSSKRPWEENFPKKIEVKNKFRNVKTIPFIKTLKEKKRENTEIFWRRGCEVF